MKSLLTNWKAYVVCISKTKFENMTNEIAWSVHASVHLAPNGNAIGILMLWNRRVVERRWQVWKMNLEVS